MNLDQARPKIDLFRLHRAEYTLAKKPVQVDVGDASYLVVRGSGEPGSERFQARLAALYAMAYTLKFASKAAGQDYAVGKLEGLYGVDGQRLEELEQLPKAAWKWRLMIRVPDFVTDADLDRAWRTLRDKGKEGEFGAVFLDTFREGPCVQMLHIGPYEEEHRTLAAMRAFAREHGLAPHRWHHEIYLSDPRRVPPERLRTLLRMPVEAS